MRRFAFSFPVTKTNRRNQPLVIAHERRRIIETGRQSLVEDRHNDDQGAKSSANRRENAGRQLMHSAFAGNPSFH
jgi:hypothetical protein